MSDVLPVIDLISWCDVACPGESSHAEGSYRSSCLLMDGILALVLVIKWRRSIVAHRHRCSINLEYQSFGCRYICPIVS